MKPVQLNNDDIVNMCDRANGLAMDLMLYSTKLHHKEVEEIVLPGASVRAIANLTMAAASFQIALLDVIDKQVKKERAKKTN